MSTGVVQQLLQALREQQVPQPLHLGLQLPDQFGVWILVDHGVTADLFGAVSVPAAISQHLVKARCSAHDAGTQLN